MLSITDLSFMRREVLINQSQRLVSYEGAFLRTTRKIFGTGHCWRSIPGCNAANEVLQQVLRPTRKTLYN